ncbi:SHOCT domain-containing protein [Flavobacterium sp. D11R37]|uniref:SHOCT domain-containing protein n=1 Tax=Flavobacterium coralii TaxID=2838017 RepID=UPI001CA68E61|nr:SHOCT domain-containing protein [Flavobacterium coralii]MBY8963867.1 SHOCT domain-containing protein [Flavobacterium coralii]
MNKKVISFISGDIEISEDRILFRSIEKNAQQQISIERYNMGGVNIEEFSYLSIRPTQISLRMLLLGIIIAIIAMVISVEPLSFLGVVMIIFGIVMFNVGLWVDGFLGTKIAYNVYSYLFASKGYKVSIQNNSGGGHIEFYIALNQLKEAEQLDTFRLKEKPETAFPSNGLNDLEKISELFKRGILTEEEFIQKKKQLLNI